MKRLFPWIARVTAAISTAIILILLVGEGVHPGEIEIREWLGLLFFPVGMVAGFAIAWRHPLQGAVISLVSLFAFYFIVGLLLYGRFAGGPAFLILSSPAALFLWQGLQERRDARATRMVGTGVRW